MKYGVLAIPPKTGLFSDLKPRFQFWAGNEKIVEYDSFEKAEEYAKICRNEKSTLWTYIIKEI